MERLPINDDGSGYGTGAVGSRVHAKRKGALSARCLLVTSAIVVAVLVGALHFMREAPASSPLSKPTHAKMHSVAVAHAAHQAPTPHKKPVGKVATGVSSLRSRTGSPVAAKSASSLSAHELAHLPADVRTALNTSVDPCDNFYEFACGGWDSATKIPSWQSSWAKQWDGVTTDVETKAVKALEKDSGPAGKFYQSCMDTATVQKLGAKPLKTWLASVEKIKDHASLLKGLADFAIADMTAFFGWWVDADSEDSSLNSFFVAQVCEPCYSFTRPACSPENFISIYV